MRRLLWAVLFAVVPMFFAVPAIADSNITLTADPSYATAAPNVTASNATDISISVATVHGNVTDMGGGAVTMRGFEWGTETGNYTLSWNETGDFGTGTFDHQIGNLTFCSEFFWRAFAVNDYGRGNSTELSFWTTCLPSAPTDFTITQMGYSTYNTSWTMGLGYGTYNISWTMGVAANITVIRVSEADYPSSVSDGYEVYSGNATYVLVDGLNPDMTTYYFRAWSHNQYGYSPDYAEASLGSPIGIPSILFVVGLCGFGLWKRGWIRAIMAVSIVMWGAFAMPYDIKIAAPLLAVGLVLFFIALMSIPRGGEAWQP